MFNKGKIKELEAEIERLEQEKLSTRRKNNAESNTDWNERNELFRTIDGLQAELENRKKLPMFDYELVEDTTELIALGAQADGLLRDDIFCRAYTELLKDLRVWSAATEPQDTEQREQYYYLIKALQDLVSKINGYAIRAQVRELELNEER